MQPNTATAPEATKPGKRQLPPAMQAQVIADHFKKVVLALGVEPGGSLAQLTEQAETRAKAARNVLDQTASALAYLDGALDALGYSTPDDLRRAKRQVESAHRALEIAIKTAAPTPPADEKKG
jgi:hypothetical protein